MGVLVKKPETEAKIRELASLTGETLTDAIDRAVEERLARIPAVRGRIDRARLAALQAEGAALPRINEHLSDDDILDYDAFGVPR